MTALFDKLQNAGADTIGARLTTACIEGVRKYPNSPADAWRAVGSIFGHQFIRALMDDMKIDARPKPKLQEVVQVTPYRSRVIAPERLERRRVMQEIIHSKYKTSANISWSMIGWHELPSLTRDGEEASALLKAGPATVPNDGRNVGQVLGVKKVDEIIAKVREKK